jgi:hypothetical protein
MRQFLLISLLLLPALLPEIAFADGRDPWCLIRDENEICAYKTAQECYGSAQYGGYCRENYKLMGDSDGKRNWCVITATRRDCKYSRNRCLKRAIEVGGGCVENTEKALERASGRGWGKKSKDEDEDFDFEEIG